jgi:hypothetical protein
MPYGACPLANLPRLAAPLVEGLAGPPRGLTDESIVERLRSARADSTEHEDPLAHRSADGAHAQLLRQVQQIVAEPVLADHLSSARQMSLPWKPTTVPNGAVAPGIPPWYEPSANQRPATISPSTTGPTSTVNRRPSRIERVCFTHSSSVSRPPSPSGTCGIGTRWTSKSGWMICSAKSTFPFHSSIQRSHSSALTPADMLPSLLDAAFSRIRTAGARPPCLSPSLP